MSGISVLAALRSRPMLQFKQQQRSVSPDCSTNCAFDKISPSTGTDNDGDNDGGRST